MQRIAPGLFRWTCPHPDWRGDQVEPDHPLDWPREVGCVAAEVGDAVVLIDPLVDDWEELDALAGGRATVVLTTLPFHARSGEAAVERYRATTDLVDGVEEFAVPHAGEHVFWLPAWGALVPGDCLVNRPRDGRLRVLPQPWLKFTSGEPTRADVARDLAQLLDRPISLVLVSHGEPVLSDGLTALAAAVDEATDAR